MSEWADYPTEDEASGIRPEAKAVADWNKYPEADSGGVLEGTMSTIGDIKENMSLEGMKARGIEALTGAAEFMAGMVGVRQSFSDRLKQDWKERGKEVGTTFEDYSTGDIGITQATIQTLGKGGFGGFLDLSGQVLVAGFEGASLLIPNEIEQSVKEGVITGAKWLAETDVGQLGIKALQGGVETYNEWSSQNPQAAKTLESVVNVGAVLAPVKVKRGAHPVVADTTAAAADKAKRVLGKSVAKSIGKNKREYVQDLLKPFKEPEQGVQQRIVERVKFGLKESVYHLNKKQKEVADELFKVKGLQKGLWDQEAYNLVSETNRRIGKVLKGHIAKSSAKVDRVQVMNLLDDTMDDFFRESAAVRGAEAPAKAIVEKAHKLLRANENTPLGIFKARKKLDKWMLAQYGEEGLFLGNENTMKLAVRRVREVLNDAVDATVTSIGVKKQLHRQHLLFNAMDELAIKAHNEAKTSIGRLIKNAGTVLKYEKAAPYFIGAATGVTAYGGMTLMAPYMPAIVVGVPVAIGAKVAITSPSSRKFIAKMIGMADDAIKSSTNQAMIRELRMDRAYLMEIMKQSSQEPTDE